MRIEPSHVPQASPDRLPQSHRLGITRQVQGTICAAQPVSHAHFTHTDAHALAAAMLLSPVGV